ncbi:hypothetical protein SNE40_015561 [Patella caerulea]|uniref:Niemann-Pick C1 N-terminal domain-containing protein n=1 Tax=Patella caerulea TaxID=87958 RepID=A0AAN8JHL4_PATCE
MGWTRYLVYLIFTCFIEEIKTTSNGKGQCIWYDTCGKDPSTGKPLNCVYNGPAKQLNDTTGLKLLQKYCPALYIGQKYYWKKN